MPENSYLGVIKSLRTGDKSRDFDGYPYIHLESPRYWIYRQRLEEGHELFQESPTEENAKLVWDRP